MRRATTSPEERSSSVRAGTHTRWAKTSVRKAASTFCPTDCIHMGKLHDLSSYSRREAVIEFAELAKQGLHTPLPIWMERNADKIPWVKSELERIKAGELATHAADIPGR